MGQRRFITFKVEDELAAEDVSLRARGPAREPARERWGRCLRFCGFCCVCTGTLFQVLAPWMLSVIEVVTLLLLLLLLCAPAQHPGPYAFSFHTSLEDLVLLGALRAAAICGTYAYGSSSFHFRPYLFTSYITGCAGLLYVLPKACLYAYPPVVWLPPAALMAVFGTFSWLHILAARFTVTWYRRRGQLGLLQGPLLPRQRTAAGFRRSMSHESLPATSPAWLDDSQADVPAELLADPDSQFVDVDGLTVHYKQAAPTGSQQAQAAAAGSSSSSGLLLQPPSAPVMSAAAAAASPEDAVSLEAEDAGECSSQLAGAQAQGQLPAEAAAPRCAGDVAVVLVHSFGGGVFAFRHIMQQLADELGVLVVALDRPGFGLTARPEVGSLSQSGEAQQQQQSGASASSSSQREPLLPTHLNSNNNSSNGASSSNNNQQQQSQLDDPYSFPGQAQLLLRFCQVLGLRRVLLVAHADGCVVAAHAAVAAAAAAAHQQQQPQPPQQQQPQPQGAAAVPEVLGLALLHPNLGSGNQVPAFTRLLASSSLGRSMLRPLLRSEVGVVSARRAWHSPELLTPEVLWLYKRPLRVQGWDAALMACSRATARLQHKQVLAQLAAVRDLPALLVSGEFDRIAPSAHAASLAALLTRVQCAVVPACGHLSHEEAPRQLVALLAPFLCGVLDEL